MLLRDCRVIELPKIADYRGNLTFVEGGNHIPFEIQRVYYLYGVPDGASRASHAHRALHQLIISISGTFDVTLDDGREKKIFHMNRPYFGLYTPPMIWRNLDNFSTGSICMVLASDYYDENDYFRDYQDFLKAVNMEQR